MTESFSRFAHDAIFLTLKAGALQGLDISQALEIIAEQVEYIRLSHEADDGAELETFGR